MCNLSAREIVVGRLNIALAAGSSPPQLILDTNPLNRIKTGNSTGNTAALFLPICPYVGISSRLTSTPMQANNSAEETVPNKGKWAAMTRAREALGAFHLPSNEQKASHRRF